MTKIWRWLPAGLAHELAPLGLAVYSSFTEAPPAMWSPLQWHGMVFPNRLGTAGGVDKNARQILNWQSVGAGFVEVGTITPLEQDANPGKVIDRDWAQRALWNRLGFPNDGADEIYYNLRGAQSDLQIPVFVNIGKNRQTANAEALTDYQFLAKKFSPLASALVINVSSPNTQGLRDLQSSADLQKLVDGVTRAAGRTPVLVKLSPDLTLPELQASIDAALAGGASGFVLTNTTLSRSASRFPKEGGVSGLLLSSLSKKSLRDTISYLGSRRDGLLIVSVGGVLSVDDVKERLQMGADLVQVYAALVFEGPGFFRQVAQQIQTRGAVHER